MTAVKRCPRCGQLKSAEEFYRRRRGRRLSAYCQPCTRAAARQAQRRRRRLSSYCQPCTRAASRQAQSRRRQDPTAAEGLRAVDRVRQRRRRALGSQGGDR